MPMQNEERTINQRYVGGEMPIKQYTMTENILSNLQNKEVRRTAEINKGVKSAKFTNPIAACRFCRKDFKIGDIIVAPTASSRRKRYHKDCAIKVHVF